MEPRALFTRKVYRFTSNTHLFENPPFEEEGQVVHTTNWDAVEAVELKIERYFRYENNLKHDRINRQRVLAERERKNGCNSNAVNHHGQGNPARKPA